MEELYKKIKSFLISTVNETLETFEDERVTLPRFTEKNVVFGTIDPLKNNSAMICSIYPESQDEEDGTISEIQTASVFTLTIVSRLSKYETLIAQTCRYADAILMAFEQDCSMDNAVDNSNIGERKFYPDCGIADKQATAVEIKLTIYENKEI